MWILENLPEALQSGRVNTIDSIIGPEGQEFSVYLARKPRFRVVSTISVRSTKEKEVKGV